MMVLWLRFLTEINSNTKDIPADLLNDPEIGKAVEDLEVSGFTDAELRAYDKFWDSVSVERTLLDDRYQKGMEEGMEKGMEQGMEKKSRTVIMNLLKLNMPIDNIAAATESPIPYVKEIAREAGYSV